jgi:hypothetical protein
MLRAWVVDRIKADAIIMTALGEGDAAAGPVKVMSAGAAGLPGHPDLLPPFLVVRAVAVVPALEKTNVQQIPYFIWVHDQQGSFEDVIGTVLTRLRQIMPTSSPEDTDDGETIMACVWQGDSADLFDEGFGTATRYGQYQVTARVP